MNDYMAAYHDAVLLIGQVMRKIISKNESEVEEMEFMNVNYFRNTSFNGKREEAHVVDLRPGSFVYFLNQRPPTASDKMEIL